MKKVILALLFVAGSAYAAKLSFSHPASSGGGGLGGSTGATDRAILIANGTGGATVQASAALVDISNNVTATAYKIIGDSSFLFANDHINTQYGFRIGFGNGVTPAMSILGNNTSQDFSSMLYVQSNKSTNPGLLLQPFDTNTANNIEVRNSTAVLLFSVTGTGAAKLIGKTSDPCADTTGFPADSIWTNTTNHVLCTCVSGASKRASDGSTSCF